MDLIFSYPACFYPFEEDGGGFVVVFPDLPGCTTGGETIQEALYMANDAACGWILTALEEGETLPKPTDYRKVKADEYENGFVSLMPLDVDEYSKKFGSEDISKSCSIPLWLNTLAENKNLNFSTILQKGLQQELGLSQSIIHNA
jgi:predicted RNase H-like HicB family nuclease